MAYVVYTSGSTGRPKGVAIEHHSLSHVARALVDAYDVRPGDRVLQFASPSWDTMVEEIFPTLLVGATLVLRSNDMIETTALVRGCSAHGVTIANLPTAIWHRLVADLEDGLTVPKTLRTMIIGGEPAAPERIETWFARAGARIRLVNTYGLTEAAAVCTLAELSHVESPVPIGAPLPRVGVSIRNEQLEVVGDGVHGEICISGEGVARGYLNRPEATALKFAPDGSGNRIYRSGDSGFRRSDGQFVCLGRLDDQIKVGGVRVEPGEIAAVLRRHYAVAEAVVLAHDADGDRRLVAYVVLHTSAILPAAHLRAFARDHLPAVMVPEIVLLDALPLTASGKIDRQKLLPKGPAVSDVGRAPASGVVGSEPLEAALCALAREVTGAASLGPDDDFFDAGGDSLVATRLIVRARRELGLEVSFERILTGRTMRAVAANGRTGARETPSLELHRRDPSDRGETPSLGQEWYWRVQQSEPETTAHNLTWIVHVRGELDPELVERVLGELVQRHETLRTILAEDDTGLHAIALPHPRIWLRRLDWTEDARTAAHVTAFAERETETPFDLATELPFRATAIKRDESLYALVFCIHHIAIDGWSLGIVAREAEAVYGALRRGEKASLPPLPIAYSDYVAWERALLASEAAEKQLAYWRRQLRGAPSSLALPFDRPRAEHHAARGARIQHLWSGSAWSTLRVRAKEHAVTPFMLLLALFATSLGAWSGETDVVIGTPIAGRCRPELEPLIGFFPNTLALRIDLSGDPTFVELVRRVRAVCLGGFAHAEVPSDIVVRALDAREDPPSPLYRVMLSFPNAPFARPTFEGLELEVEELDQPRGFHDLLLEVVERGEGASLCWEYNCELFDRRTAERMADDFAGRAMRNLEPFNHSLAR